MRRLLVAVVVLGAAQASAEPRWSAAKRFVPRPPPRPLVIKHGPRDQTAELVYHAAQAFRHRGDRALALEHYERYLQLAPAGPAANDCRAQIEKLRDALP